jgi:hypothetical protein
VLDDGSAGDFCFGYRSYYLDPDWQNASRRGPKPKKGIRIYDPEAEVVRQVFKQFIAGRSISQIAGDLNAHGVDKGHRASRPGWHHEQVRRMLSNRKYVGCWTWGKTRTTRNSAGKKKQVSVAKEEIIERERPELRIIDNETWRLAQERLAILNRIYGRRENQQKRGPRPHYTETYPHSLLGGLLFCGTCGARLVHQQGGSGVYYGCPQHRKRLCAQTIRVPRARAEEALLSFLQDERRRSPEWLPCVLNSMRMRLKELSERMPSEIETRSSERAKLEREIENLTTAIAESGSRNGALTAALNEREARLETVLQELDEAQRAVATEKALPDEAWFREQLNRLADLLREDPQQAALLLRHILGKVEAHEVRLRGKKRGYAQLRFRFNGWRVAQEAARNSAGEKLRDKTSGKEDPGVREVTLDLGAPTRMDEWGPKIDQMRREKVSWREIGKISSLGTGNACNAWKRWTDGEGAEAGVEAGAVA